MQHGHGACENAEKLGRISPDTRRLGHPAGRSRAGQLVSAASARKGGDVATLSAGMDMAKATFTGAWWRDGRGQGLGTYPNTPTGFGALADRLGEGRRDGGSLHL